MIVFKLLWINIISDSISTVNSKIARPRQETPSGFLDFCHLLMGGFWYVSAGEFGNFLRRKVAFRDLLVEF